MSRERELFACDRCIRIVRFGATLSFSRKKAGGDVLRLLINPDADYIREPEPELEPPPELELPPEPEPP